MKHLIPNYEEAKIMYLNGISLTQINKELGIDRKKLSKALKADGCDIRINNQKHTYNETYFDVIDTEDKAYWLGFLYADGNVDNFSKYEVRVGLAYQDRAHVLKLRDILCPTMELRECITVLDGKEYPNIKLTVTNKKLVETLVDKGCVPRKSLTLTFPSEDIVPRELIHHFIRGYFDGDGSVYNTSKSTGFNMLGTEDFISTVQSIFQKDIADYTITKQHLKGKAWYFTKRGKLVIPIREYLYKDATIYLERKHEKFYSI